jgi:hypothetical protein
MSRLSVINFRTKAYVIKSQCTKPFIMHRLGYIAMSRLSVTSPVAITLPRPNPTDISFQIPHSHGARRKNKQARANGQKNRGMYHSYSVSYQGGMYHSLFFHMYQTFASQFLNYTYSARWIALHRPHLLQSLAATSSLSKSGYLVWTASYSD